MQTSPLAERRPARGAFARPDADAPAGGIRSGSRAAQAAPVRRRVVAMPTLGSNGRFGNQLFQYLFLRLCARKRGLLIQTPKWAGQEIFGFSDPPVATEPAVLVSSEEISDLNAFIETDPRLGDDVALKGWFHYHSSQFRPHREFIRRLFVLRPDLRAYFSQALAQIRRSRRPLVAVHIRRGDYGYRHFFRAPSCWYADWLRSGPGAGPATPLVYICSESPEEVAPFFADWHPLHAGLMNRLPTALRFLMDFYVMTQADALAISNSSFSFMAAMLNERARSFVRPTLDDGRLVPFDPWGSIVVLQRELEPGEQERLDDMDRVPAGVKGAPSGGN